MIKVEQPPPELAAALGRTGGPKKRRRKGGKTCEDCFFHKRMLCALALEEPCSTFRPDTPDGLVPPRQPSLLLRQAANAPLADPA